MPGTIADLIYALLVIGFGIIAWMVNKGFDFLKATFREIAETLKGIRTDLKTEHDERVALRAEMISIRRICDERHTVRRVDDRE